MHCVNGDQSAIAPNNPNSGDQDPLEHQRAHAEKVVAMCNLSLAYELQRPETQKNPTPPTLDRMSMTGIDRGELSLAEPSRGATCIQSTMQSKLLSPEYRTSLQNSPTSVNGSVPPITEEDPRTSRRGSILSMGVNISHSHFCKPGGKWRLIEGRIFRDSQIRDEFWLVTMWHGEIRKSAQGVSGARLPDMVRSKPCHIAVWNRTWTSLQYYTLSSFLPPRFARETADFRALIAPETVRRIPRYRFDPNGPNWVHSPSESLVKAYTSFWDLRSADWYDSAIPEQEVLPPIPAAASLDRSQTRTAVLTNTDRKEVKPD